MQSASEVKEESQDLQPVSKAFHKGLLFEINNISIGAPSPVHAILVTFPENFNNQLIMGLSAGLELAIFSFTAVMMNYSHNERIKSYENKIKLLSNASNSFVFTYGMCCEIVSLVSGNELQLTAPVIGLLSSVLVASVGVSGVTLYRDRKESRFDESELSSAWKKMSKGLNCYLFFIAAFNLVNQVVKLIQAVRSQQDDDHNVLEIIEILLFVATLLAPFIGMLLDKQISKGMTKYLGAFNNVVHDVAMEVASQKLSQPGSALTLASLLAKPVLGLGIFAHKSCANKSEGMVPLLSAPNDQSERTYENI